MYIDLWDRHNYNNQLEMCLNPGIDYKALLIRKFELKRYPEVSYYLEILCILHAFLIKNPVLWYRKHVLEKYIFIDGYLSPMQTEMAWWNIGLIVLPGK